MSLEHITNSLAPNRLGLIRSNGDVDIEATRSFIDLSIQQLADAFGFTENMVRVDRASEKVKEKIKELAYALELVAEAFNGNEEKTKYWFKTPNPHFGGIAPRALIIRGRFKRVQQFVLGAQKRYSPAR